MSEPIKTWSSRTGFIMATAGASVGLGNLWRFPFMAGENGGGLFIFFYLISVLAIAFPIMFAELILGQSGGGNAIYTLKKLTKGVKYSFIWKIIGVLSLAIPMLGIAFYSVVGGWVFDYTAHAVIGDIVETSAEQSQLRFDEMLSDPLRTLFSYTLFILALVFVLLNGIQKGIERSSKILMPILFLFMIFLVIYAMFKSDFIYALKFLFIPDFSKFSGEIILLAVGQAFFSLTIGVGTLITYGSYVTDISSLKKSTLIICGMDTFVALTAGLAIFPFVFDNNLDPAGGPGLIFVTMPAAFGQMLNGTFLGIVFFILLFCAAFSTGLGTMQPVIAWLSDMKSLTHKASVWITGICTWLLGLGALFSFNILSDIKPLDFIPLYEGKNIFESFDVTIISVLLPINSILISLFVGWVLDKKIISKIGLNNTLSVIFTWSLRIFIPVTIVLIFLNG